MSKSLSPISQTASEIFMEPTGFFMIQALVSDAFAIANSQFKVVQFNFNGVEVVVPRDGSMTQEQVLAAYFATAQSAASTPLSVRPAPGRSSPAPETAPRETAAPDVNKAELLTLVMATSEAMAATKIAIDGLRRLSNPSCDQSTRLQELEVKQVRYSLMHKKLSTAVKAFDQIASTGA